MFRLDELDSDSGTVEQSSIKLDELAEIPKDDAYTSSESKEIPDKHNQESDTELKSDSKNNSDYTERKD